MALKEFLLSKTFRKHFLIAILLTIVLLWLSMMMLSLYTHRGEKIAVPDFTGLTMDQALRAAKKMNLRIEVVDSVYRAGKTAGTVLMQNPGTGHKVKSGRLISLTLVSSVPGQEEVPKLTDISLRQAKVLLESKGFVVGKVEFRHSEFNDLVLEQKSNGIPIAPGSHLDSGSYIDLVVGLNIGSNETFIPDFSGLTFAEAQIIIELHQLMPGTVTFDETVVSHEDSVAAKVFSQDPAADSTLIVPTGSIINLVLSLKAKDEPATPLP
jgi:eukaryotic-like serine/threonine-protein kinase